jgi:hypothetical protein
MEVLVSADHVAGITLFPIIYLFDEAARRGYDPWRETISALSLGGMDSAAEFRALWA